MINSYGNKTTNIILNDTQKNFNKFLNKRLKDIYEYDFVKKNYFKKNIWKKNEFIRITKRFKSCEGTFNKSYLKNNF